MVAFGCTAQPSVPPSLTDADRFAKLYSELAGTYEALILATTPTVEGAEPLLSMERGRQIMLQLDSLKSSLDVADDIRQRGIGGFQNPETLAAVLRAIRAQIPTGDSA